MDRQPVRPRRGFRKSFRAIPVPSDRPTKQTRFFANSASEKNIYVCARITERAWKVQTNICGGRARTRFWQTSSWAPARLGQEVPATVATCSPIERPRRCRLDKSRNATDRLERWVPSVAFVKATFDCREGRRREYRVGKPCISFDPPLDHLTDVQRHRSGRIVVPDRIVEEARYGGFVRWTSRIAAPGGCGLTDFGNLWRI